MASVWEMSIKASLGKLDLALPFDQFICHELSVNRIKLLSIKLAHVLQVASLPYHHRDPFDRLIIAQALCEEITIIGNDEEFKKYSVNLMW